MKKFVIWTAIISIVAIPVILGIAYVRRDLPPLELKEKTFGSIKKARKENAARYAEDDLEKAERLYRIGLSLLGKESVRLYFLRDFDVARSRFRDAANSADFAGEIAKGTREALKFNAESGINEGQSLIDGIDNLKKTIRLDYMRARKLRRAKISIDQAEIYYKAGEYARAVEQAEDAIDKLEEVQEVAVNVARRMVDWNHIQQWKSWIDNTIANSAQNGSAAIIVDKLKHTLSLYQGGRKTYSFKADLGFNFINDKYYSGDDATPEGKYKVIKKKGRGQTIYYKALLLNYPNHEDWRRFEQAKNRGHISKNARIGGMIEIHGDGGRNADWTKGCVALSNPDMDRLFAAVEVGTPVTIVGSSGLDREFAEFIAKNGKNGKNGSNGKSR